MRWPQTSANNELCLPGVGPNSRPRFNENKSLWVTRVTRWRRRTRLLTRGPFSLLPTDLRFINRSLLCTLDALWIYGVVRRRMRLLLRTQNSSVCLGFFLRPFFRVDQFFFAFTASICLWISDVIHSSFLLFFEVINYETPFNLFNNVNLDNYCRCCAWIWLESFPLLAISPLIYNVCIWHQYTIDASIVL